VEGSEFKEPPLTAESSGPTRAALLAMRAHRGTGSSNPLPSTGESAANLTFERASSAGPPERFPEGSMPSKETDNTGIDSEVDTTPGSQPPGLRLCEMAHISFERCH
jgi:hypothetical protein